MANVECYEVAAEDILVSIVIPAYNVEKCIRKAVSSILKQTHGNLEVIIVLNGCTDGSLSVCQTIANKDPRVRVVENDVKGALQARKRGILEARGQYLTFVDADDVYVKRSAVECMLGTTLKSGSQICHFGQYKELPLGFRRKTPWTRKGVGSSVEIYDFPESRDNVFVGIAMQRFGAFTGYTWDKMYSCDVLQGVVRCVGENFFYGDDALLNAYACLSPGVKSVAVCGDAYYLYRRGGALQSRLAIKCLRMFNSARKPSAA